MDFIGRNRNPQKFEAGGRMSTADGGWTMVDGHPTMDDW
jgi:hypothetical protein